MGRHKKTNYEKLSPQVYEMMASMPCWNVGNCQGWPSCGRRREDKRKNGPHIKYRNMDNPTHANEKPGYAEKLRSNKITPLKKVGEGGKIQQQDRFTALKPVYGRNYKDYHRTGLKNIGNSCYMNAIIQCLVSTETLVRDLTKLSKSKSFDLPGMTSELVFLSRVLNSGEFRVISPSNFKQELGKADLKYVPATQQDAQDALQTILQNMEEELEHEGVCAKLNKKIIQETFDGKITRSTKCTKCMNETSKTDPMRFMNLEIPQGNNTLEECFQSYMKEEVLYDKRCENCCISYEAKIKTEITQTPNVMIIQLKRFKNGERLPSKIKKHIRIPLMLELGPYIGQG